MNQNIQVLFQEAWEVAEKRVNAGKHSKDKIRFFLTDGTTRAFDVPPMRDDQMKDEFLEITLKAINNHPVEALMLNFEAWFVETDEKVDDLGKYLKNNSFPRNNPKRREGVSFYYEAADGTMVSTLAEIMTVKKEKRQLGKLQPLSFVSSPESRMSHFFEKAREYSKTHKNIIDEIIGRN